jgi:hypothetical protein
MATAQGTSRLGSGLRKAFGVVVFVAWGILTFLWIYDAVVTLIEGNPVPAIKSIVTILIWILLAGMEGLEVAVIHGWKMLYPERTTGELAEWIAARQLFVALIVTAAALLSVRDSIVLPGSSTPYKDPVVLQVSLLVWGTLTVLWFMQIFPKFLAATNTERYLRVTQKTLFPLVEFVRAIGIALPGEWTATAVERWIDWRGEPTFERAPGRRQSVSLTDAWAALSPKRAQAATRRPPDDRATGSPES